VAALLPTLTNVRKVLMAVGCVFVFVLTIIFAGPASSGGLFLLGASPSVPAADHPLPAGYEPVHKGGVDLGTGLYVRENEDLLVDGTPPLVLRRTYLSGYRVSRQFGIGTTHNGEESLAGDRERFQWVALFLARGTRINFKRVSPGTSVLNALYVHDESATEWLGARLGWTGLNWALRKRDGSLALYQGCGGRRKHCAIIQDRDAHGHTIHYRRDRSGTLVRMETGADRWIAFEHDASGRAIRAHDSTSREARYTYDARGRLVRVTTSDGIVHRYGYTDADELATIEEPDTSIENVYRDGRVVRQVNRFPDREPYTFDFTYTVEAGRLVATGTRRSDGSWAQYTWDEHGRSTSEIIGQDGLEPAVFTYQRDPTTGGITALTLTCPDRQGRPLRHTGVARDGNEEAVKQNLLQTHCYWKTRRRR
jgi:YD repeat-containing protein